MKPQSLKPTLLGITLGYLLLGILGVVILGIWHRQTADEAAYQDLEAIGQLLLVEAADTPSNFQDGDVQVSWFVVDHPNSTPRPIKPENTDLTRVPPEIAEALRSPRARNRRSDAASNINQLVVCIADPPAKTPRRIVRIARNEQPFQFATLTAQRFTAIITLLSWIVTCSILLQRERGLRRPLARLTQFARALARGELDETLDLETRQRVGTELGDAFDRILARLRKREAEMVGQDRQLETILASMAEGVIAVSETGQIEFVNEAARRALGIPRGPLGGRSLHDVVRFPQMLEAHERARTSRQSVKLEFETVGDPRWILSLRIDPLPGPSPSGTVIVLRDVTELRALETMRRDFVTNVSHELKTPLSAIKAYAETLRLGAIHDEANRDLFVSEIETQADRLHALILDLIQLARIESLQNTFDRERLDLDEIVLDAVEPFYGVAESRQLTLDVHIEGKPIVEADAEGLHTIVDNLVSNALRYTPAGGRVDVRCTETESGVRLEVEDTGIGIAPEHQQRVFERFYRVDRARSRDLGGTGLGLAIVKHLVQAFDGSIELTSRVGVGTRIKVELPAASNKNQSNEVQATPTLPAKSP